MTQNWPILALFIHNDEKSSKVGKNRSFLAFFDHFQWIHEKLAKNDQKSSCGPKKGQKRSSKKGAILAILDFFRRSRLSCPPCRDLENLYFSAFWQKEAGSRPRFFGSSKKLPNFRLFCSILGQFSNRPKVGLFWLLLSILWPNGQFLAIFG